MSQEPPPSLPFEQSMERLTRIVEKLEKGDLPLEQSLQLFEEGVRLSRLAQERLDSAQQRIERLLTVDSQGKPRTTPFGASPTSSQAPATPDVFEDDGNDEPPF